MNHNSSMDEEQNTKESNFDEIELNQEEPLSQEEIDSNGGVPVRQQLILVAGILVLIFGTTLSPKLFSYLSNDEVEESTPLLEEERTITPKATPSNHEVAFDEINLIGEAAYVWDVNAQRAIFKKNESEVLPLASVTKLMTALLANEILAEDSDVSINDLALNQDGDSGLLLHEVFDRLTLSDLTLISSSNDGAFALALAAGSELDANDSANAFVKAMNVRAKELGLTETVFYNPTGLDISNSDAGAYGTAKDMTFLMEYIIENDPDILAYTQEDSTRVYSETGQSHEASNTNYYTEEIPGLIGSKTGYTDLAGGNLVIAYDAGLNRPIIITVLGSTQHNRFTDVMQLVEATNNYLTN